MKRPIVIEFSGLPNSGKTTLLHNLKSMCDKNNLTVTIVQESAELLPKSIQKGSFQQNSWIRLETLKKLLEVPYITDCDFVFIDRGFYDGIFWQELYKEKNLEYYELMKNFYIDFALFHNLLPNYFLVVDVSVKESLRRRMSSNEPVTMSKEDFLTKYQKCFKNYIKDIPNTIYIDTTFLTPDEVAIKAFTQILSLNK